MAHDFDEEYTSDEMLGIWKEKVPEENNDLWDFSKYSPLHKGVGKPVAVAAEERRLAIAQAKQQALNALIPMLLKGRSVLSARKLCRIASFNVRGMECPDVNCND